MARIVVAGYMVRNPLGGLLWVHLQYLLGLVRLGHDVYFFEEFGWPNSCYDYENDRISDDAGWGLRTFGNVMSRFKLDQHWVYRDAQGRYHGLSAKRAGEILSSADLLLNLSGASWFEDFERVPVRVFVDQDPVWTQFGSAGDAKSVAELARHTRFFTWGYNIGQPRCPVPTLGFHWRPTRMPLVLHEWPMRFDANAKLFTTVMTWDAYGSVRYGGHVYGPKSKEFLKLIKLPSRTPQGLEVAIGEAPLRKIVKHGWHVRDAVSVSRTIDSYRDYIQQSRGEFSIVKHGFAKAWSGMFFDRSAAYLASGKPVVLEETGFSDWLPVGEGLLSFLGEEEAAGALEAVNGDYKRHCEAARTIAEEFFDSDKVLSELLAAM